MIVTTDFLNINGSIRCINVFVLMLIGFVRLFLFLSSLSLLLFVAGVDLDPSRKMSPTFPYPDVI